MKFKVDTLLAKGKAHSVNCEDCLLYKETDELIISAVFDGCSSGIDSCFASNYHKYLLKNINYEFIKSPIYTMEEKLKEIMTEVRYGLDDINYIRNEEMLSTMVILLIDKVNNKYGILFCGDGCYSINGEHRSIHSKYDNSVLYLSVINCNNVSINEYYEYCHKVVGDLKPDMELSISSDGIESFITKYGSFIKDEAKELLFNTDRYEERYKKFTLQRLYNIFIKGKCKDIFNEEVINIDDLSMIKIKAYEGEV